jgi:hypothetical protein
MTDPSPTEETTTEELSPLIDDHAGEEDLVEESVELPPWIATAFGIVLVLIALLAIWSSWVHGFMGS